MLDILFDPEGSLVECTNISIGRDLLVENDEMFRFTISPNQTDESVQVGSPDSLNVTIVDEADGESVVE